MNNWFLLVFILATAACATTQQPFIPEHVQIVMRHADTYSGSTGLAVDIALTYRHPLKTPFKVYADLRCREEGEPWDVQSILTTTLGTNMLPGESNKIDWDWPRTLNFASDKEHVCKIRIFSVQRPILRVEDSEQSYDFIDTWCLKGIQKAEPHAPGYQFILSDPKLCQ